MTIYFAYGSNLNLGEMKKRCPKGEPLGKWVLNDSRLVFRGVADCIYEPRSKCYGGLWKISLECEAALDRYEGYRPDGYGMYRKVKVELTEPFHGESSIMLYTMNSTETIPPSVSYLKLIEQGYRDFGLPLRALYKAVKASWDDRNPSHVERQHHNCNGRPALANVNPERIEETASVIDQTERAWMTRLAFETAAPHEKGRLRGP